MSGQNGLGGFDLGQLGGELLDPDLLANADTSIGMKDVIEQMSAHPSGITSPEIDLPELTISSLDLGSPSIVNGINTGISDNTHELSSISHVVAPLTSTPIPSDFGHPQTSGAAVLSQTNTAQSQQSPDPIIGSDNNRIGPGPNANSIYTVRAEGTIYINNSRSDFDGDPLNLNDDALLYGGSGFTINGQPTLPVQRDITGVAILDDQGLPVLVENAVSVSADYSVFNAPNNAYGNLRPPQVVATEDVIVPEFEALKDQVLETALSTGSPPIAFNPYQNPINNASDWEQYFPAGGTSEQPTHVQVSGWGLNVPDGVVIENTIIELENGYLNFNGNSHQLNNVVLVMHNGGANLANVQGTDLTVISSQGINMNGGARFGKQSLLATGPNQSINFNGATNTGEDDFLTVISQRDITFNSSSDTRAEFISGGNFTFNGSATLYGSIDAEGSVFFNGDAKVVGLSVSNTAPADLALNPAFIYEDEAPGTIVGTFNTIDADAGDTHTYQLVSGEGDTDNDAFRIQNNKLRINASPDFERQETYSIRVLSTDPEGLSVEKALTVQVLDINQAPTFITEPDIEAVLGKRYTYDADAIDSDNDTLTYSMLTGPTGLIIDSETGVLTGTLNDVGTHALSIQVEDGQGGIDTQTFTLEVVDGIPNRPPVFSTTPIVDANVNTLYAYDADAIDADGDRLRYSLLSGPEGLTVDSKTGVVEWTPTSTQLGLQTIQLLVEDNRGGSATQQYDVSLQPEVGNHRPLIISDPSLTASLGTPYSYDTDAIDPENDPLEYSLVNSLDGMTIDPDSGVISWEPTPADLGTQNVQVKVSDGRGGSDIQDYTIHVESPTADLIIEQVTPSDLEFNGQTLTLTGMVSAEITNLSGGDLSQDFEVYFFEDSNANQRFDSEIDSILGTVQITEPMQEGISQTITAEIQGTVNFSGVPIWGFVDSGNVIAEIDETNNLEFSSHDCIAEITREFNPVVEWNKRDFTVAPNHHQVMMTPAVIDLNDDAIPDIVFNTFRGSNYNTNGKLRAISGKDGRELWTVTDTRYETQGATSVAVGDIDNDGNPEILVGAEDKVSLLAFEHDGRFKWRSSPIASSINWGGASLADLNQDGTTEIIVGSTVLDNQGNILWSGRSVGGTGQGINGPGPLSIAADLDLDGQLEVVAGNSAFRADGSLYWNSEINDGFNAIGNFDDDPFPEIVVVTNQTVNLLEHTGEVKWRGAYIVGGGRGGAPTVADLDGDGEPEIGVAGGTNYLVFETDGSVKWIADTQDNSSNVTGSSVFDFDGDGRSEVVYGDERFLRIYDGETGDVLYSLRKNSGTTYELPLIVDVDADGNAEIVAIANDYPRGGQQRGIFVIGDLNDTWVSARQIWNQHSYHITNINDDGTIPIQEENSWQVHNTYRLNAVLDGNPLAAPDLIPSYVRLEDSGATERTITARVGNAGAQFVGDGVNVSFYLGDPNDGGVLLGTTQTTTRLNVGGFEDVSITTLVQIDNIDDLWVVADDNGAGRGFVTECDEENNFYHVGAQSGELPEIETPENRKPVFNSTPNKLAQVNEIFRYSAVAIDPDNDSLTYSLPLAPEGMVVDPERGILVWEPMDDQTGVHDVILRVQDGNGKFDLQAFQISVDQNIVPVITSQAVKQAGINVPYQYRIQAQDADGIIASYRLDNGPIGMTVDSVTGLLSWTPTTEQLGANTVDITVSDDSGGEATQSFEINVLATLPNDAPEIVTTPRTVTQLQGLYTYRLVAEDPNSDPLSYGIVDGPEGMVIDEEGLVSWQPQPNQLGANEITLQVDDGQGAVREQTFTVNVVSQFRNQFPEITSAPTSFNATVGLPYEYDAQAVDPDGDIVFWSLGQAPAGVSIDSELGTIRWLPTADQVGSFEVVVLATDSQGGVASQSFNLTVRGANLAPQISSVPPTTGAVGRTYNYAVVAQDPEGDTVSFRLKNAPEGMSIDAQTGLINWTPTVAGFEPQDVTVEVSDSLGATSEQRFSILVTQSAINQAPAIVSQPQFAAASGTEYSYQVLATDPDSDPLTYQLVDGPAGMTIDPVSGELSWMPSASDIGTYTVAIRAIDPAGLGGAQQFTLTVTDNNAPVILSIPGEFATAGQIYRYDVRAQDPDGDSLTYELRNAPEGMTIDRLGRIRWMPEAVNAGVIAVEVVARDPKGAETIQSFNINVSVDNVAPIASVVPSIQPVELGESVTLYVSASDDVRVEQLTLMVNGEAVPLTVDGLYTFTPDVAGEINAVVIATDAAGNSTQAESRFSVLDFTDAEAPVIELPDLGDQIFTAPTEIIGTVNDDNLQSYTVSVAPLGTEDFTEIFIGTEPVTNGVLGTFDPTLLQNDSYTLRLTAEDFGGNIISVDETVSVAGDLKLGNFQLSFTDLEIPVNGIPISVTRTYDTLTSKTQDDFGFGWRLEFRDTDLRTSLGQDEAFDLFGLRTVGFDDRTRVYVTLPGGNRQAFTFKPTVNRLSAFLAGASAGIDADPNLYNPAFEADDGVTSTLSVRDPESSGNMLIRDEDGVFRNLSGQVYNPADSYFGGIYVLTTKEGIEYEIDGETGDLLEVIDLNGNTLTYTDGGIFSDTGKAVTFERDAQNRITAVIDPAGNRVTYDYDANGDLTAVSDREGNTTQLVYDTNFDDPNYPGADDVGRTKRDHFLREVIDPLGRQGARNDYDEQGRLKQLIDANGNAVELVYDPENSVQQIKDAIGNTTTYEYDSQGNILTEIDPLGGITQRTYDKNNNLLTEISPEGRVVSFTYDAQNNKLSETDPLGHTVLYTYNSRGQKLTRTSPIGTVVTDTYDHRGNRLSFQSSTGSVIKSSFNRIGQQLSLVGADGSTTWFNYDDTGNVIRQTDAEGNQVEYAYDANGKIISETKRVLVDDELQTLTTSWTYDLNGKVLSSTDPQGNITRYEYDALGQRTAIVDAQNRKTRYQYDAKGQLIDTIYPDGTSQKQAYDPLGRNISTTDALGRTTRFRYDALGRLVETILPDNTPDDLTDNPRQGTEHSLDGLITAQIDALGNRTELLYDQGGRVTLSRDALGNATTYTYDPRNIRVSQTDALGRTTRSIHDEAGRQVGTIFADGSRVSNTFNVVGLQESSTDQSGRTSYFRYDGLRRLVETILPDSTPEDLADNPRTRWEYDALGRTIAQIDPSGLRTNYRYDAGNRLIGVQDGRGEQTYTYDTVGNRISETDALGRTTHFVYDLMNRLVETQFPEGSNIKTSYDAVGNTILNTDEIGHKTQYVFDAQDRLVGVIDALNQSTEYSYDLNGNLVQITDANNHITRHEFDPLNRRTATILPLGQRTTQTYDSVGNILSSIDFNGTTTRYEYDALNRLAAKRFKDETSVLYTYTPTGQLQTTANSLGLTTYSYDAQDRLLSRVVPDGRSISYTYDIVGNRTAIQTTGGTTLYSYDPFHRLAQVTDANGGNTQYTYNAVNNLVGTILPNGIIESREYDLRNRLTFIEQSNSNSEVIASYRYTLDAVGNRTEILEYNGRQSSYSYDPLYRLTQEVITDPALGNLTQSFSYDPIGNRLSQNSSTDGLTTYSYDDNDRLLQKDHNGVVTAYTYDNNGNTLTRTSPTEQVVYQWNSEDRLVGTTTSDTNGATEVQYRYNPEGIRVGSVVDGIETRYLVDTNLPYAEVIEEYATDGSLQTSYVHGLELISQEREADQAFYLTDALGSVRLLSNLSGQVTDGYTYDAYGKLLGSTGSTENNYRYTGEQFDSNLQEYYLRARYYNPGTGRFTARDPFEGWLKNPLSLAKYPYVHGNPVNAIDPSGLFLLEQLTTIKQIGVQSATTLGTFYSTPATLARLSIIISIGIFSAYSLLQSSIEEDIDEDRFGGLPYVFFTNADMPMHRRHISNAISGNGFTKSYYEALRTGVNTPSAQPLSPVLRYTGIRREAPLSQAIQRGRDDALIANALGIKPFIIDGKAKYVIPNRAFARDEYPFATTAEGGPENWANNLVSVAVVTKKESDKQGPLLKKFYRDSGVALIPGHPIKGVFGVLPKPTYRHNSGFSRRNGSKYYRP